MSMKTRFTRNAILDKKQLWDTPVPYVLEDSLGEFYFTQSIFSRSVFINSKSLK